MKFVERYLSSEHRDDWPGGCTVAPLACAATRGNEKIQAGFSLGIEEELNIFASYFAKSFSKDEGSGFSARERAIQLMSELVGAVILARALPAPTRHCRTRYCNSAVVIFSVRQLPGHGRNGSGARSKAAYHASLLETGKG